MYFLDLVSVFAFAFFGAHAGLKRQFTLLGIITCAFLPALGGGTIREIILGHPPIYLHNYAYGIAVFLAIAFAISTKRFSKIKYYMLALDALGMIVFAYFGASAALLANLGLIGSIAFALLTACGGGILCDLLTKQTPHAFRYRYYTLPSILFGGLFWLMSAISTPSYVLILLLSITFALQLCTAYPQILKRVGYLVFSKNEGWLKTLRRSLSISGRS